jgi:PAS domain S-box-containing protein
MWQFHPLLVIFSLGGFVSLGVVVYCWRYIKRYGISYLVGGLGVLAFNNAIWAFAATGKTASASLDVSLFFYKLEFLGSGLNPALGVVIALAYIGKDRWITRKTLGVLGGISGAFVVLVLVNPGNVMIVEPVLIPAQGIQAFEHSFPPLFTVYLAWVYGLVVLSLLLLTHAAVTDRIPNGPALVVLLMLGIPLVTATLKTAGVYPPGGKGINITPAASAIGISIIAFALVQYQVVELIPVGRDRAIEVMSDGYLLVSTDGTVLDTNPAAREFLPDPDATGLTNRPVSEVIPVYEDLETSETATFTTDGQTIEVRSSNATRQNQETGTILLLQDITDKQERTQELERYERIAENVPVGVYRTTPGPDGEILFANRTAREIFGLPRDETLSGYEVQEFYANPKQSREFSERLLTEEEITGAEIRLKRANGETFWASVSGARIVDNGRVYFEGAVQDITTRKQYEQDLERAEQQARSERDGKEAIRQLLLRSATDTEITENVCQVLVDSYGYESAWITRLFEEEDDSAVTVASYGDDAGFRADGNGVTAQTLETGRAVTATVDEESETAQRLDERGLETVRSVPLVHRGITYGALTVLRAEPETELQRELVDEFGDAIAFKQQINRQRAALFADTVIELDVRITADHFLGRLSASSAVPAGTTLPAHEIGNGGETATYLVDADGDTVSAIETAATDIESIQATAVLGAESDRPTVELRVDPPTVGSVLGRHSGVVQSITATDGRVDLTVQVPRRTEVSDVVDAIREHWPDAVMRSRTKREVQTERPAVFDSLTKKQERALRAAVVAGFFDRPQQATATEVADTLGVSRSTFLHHLRTAEQKVFSEAYTD